MSEQYPLELPHATGYDAADFLPAPCNLAARALIEGWRDWPNRSAAIWGVPGAGKTHLAHVWAAASGAEVIDAEELASRELADLEPPFRYALDFGALDIGAGGLEPSAETPLFHLLNLVRERAGALLIVARAAPARWSRACWCAPPTRPPSAMPWPGSPTGAAGAASD